MKYMKISMPIMCWLLMQVEVLLVLRDVDGYRCPQITNVAVIEATVDEV